MGLQGREFGVSCWLLSGAPSEPATITNGASITCEGSGFGVLGIAVWGLMFIYIYIYIYIYRIWGLGLGRAWRAVGRETSSRPTGVPRL